LDVGKPEVIGDYFRVTRDSGKAGQALILFCKQWDCTTMGAIIPVLIVPDLMKRHVLIYGLIGGILIAVLKWTEYRFLVVEHSIEIYGGLIAATFAVLGIWLGLKLTKQKVVVKEVPIVKEILVPAGRPFVRDERRREDLGISRRELDILELIAQGLSNREIAEKLYVSENTVKTHSSRVFDKLGAKRRTQAVQLGKEFGLLP
jgi:two-component system, NarL family, response regulator LiaR